MKITVRVSGNISSVIGKRHEIELPTGATISTLANRIGEQTGQHQGYLGRFRVGSKDLCFLLNGKNIDMLNGVLTLLKDGDEVMIIQPTVGG